ncbi:MAG: DUF2169 domain-containing protein [Azoarcus sp.]|jgi:hypothetical protein|nr:DUF2169 domain-containing protein [Azoarcus sp.]
MDAPDMNSPEPPIAAAPLPEIRNRTRFPAQYFQAVDVHDEIFHILVSRVSHDLEKPDAKGMPTLCEQQQPLTEADRFYGEPGISSTLEESDFAPFKPRCDVLLAHATAYPPEGRADRRWPVGLRVGECIKKLMTGPRHMERTLSGWKVTTPEPAQEVPLHYEQAFGGSCRWPETPAEGEEPELLFRHDANPVGCGYAPPEWTRKSRPERIEAPQIEPYGEPFDNEAANRQAYPVQGVGAIGRGWAPRIAHAGTYDRHWQKERWPRLPRDFDFAYWNCAPPDQQIAYPGGGEPVILAGLRPGGGRFQSRVPGNPPFTLVRLKIGPIIPTAMPLDTLIFDLREMRLTCVYRLAVAARAGVRVLEIRRREGA